jgi:hypothetical protein
MPQPKRQLVQKLLTLTATQNRRTLGILTQTYLSCASSCKLTIEAMVHMDMSWKRQRSVTGCSKHDLLFVAILKNYMFPFFSDATDPNKIPKPTFGASLHRGLPATNTPTNSKNNKRVMSRSLSCLYWVARTCSEILNIMSAKKLVNMIE